MVALRSATRCIALAALAAAALASAGCGTLGRSELRRGVETLSSLAGEGALLARGVAADRTRSTYARVQAASVGGDAQHEAEKLADATPQAGYAARRARAVAIATAISGLLGDLQTRPGDEATGRRVERELLRVQDRAGRLVGEL